jgi:hypothetical protein
VREDPRDRALGLIDASWLPSLVPEHATRLQQLLDDPDG